MNKIILAILCAIAGAHIELWMNQLGIFKTVAVLESPPVYIDGLEAEEHDRQALDALIAKNTGTRQPKRK